MAKKTKTKTKKPAKKPARPVVAGPQLNLPAGLKEGRTPRLEETSERLRYVEPPKKKQGNPFRACRVPREMDAHWSAWLKKSGRTNAPAMREAMAKLCGYRGDTEADEDAE